MAASAAAETELHPESDPAFLRTDLALATGPSSELAPGLGLGLEAGLQAGEAQRVDAGLHLAWSTWAGDARHPGLHLSAGRLRVDGRVLLLRGPVHLTLGTGGGLAFVTGGVAGLEHALRGTSVYELGGAVEASERVRLFAFARLELLHGGGELIDLAWVELGLGAALGI